MLVNLPWKHAGITLIHGIIIIIVNQPRRANRPIGTFARSGDNFVSVIRFISRSASRVIDDLRWIGSKCSNYSWREDSNQLPDCSILREREGDRDWGR